MCALRAIFKSPPAAASACRKTLPEVKNDFRFLLVQKEIKVGRKILLPHVHPFAPGVGANFAARNRTNQRGLGQHDAAKPSPKARHGRRTTKGRRAKPQDLRRSRHSRRSRPQKRGTDAAQIRDGGKTRVFPRSVSANGRKRHILITFSTVCRRPRRHIETENKFIALHWSESGEERCPYGNFSPDKNTFPPVESRGRKSVIYLNWGKGGYHSAGTSPKEYSMQVIPPISSTSITFAKVLR